MSKTKSIAAIFIAAALLAPLAGCALEKDRESQEARKLTETYPYYSDYDEKSFSHDFQQSSSFGWDPNSLEPNIAESSNILIGKILDARSALRPSGVPYMMVDIEIESSLFGGLSKGSQITMITSGGRVPLKAFIGANIDRLEFFKDIPSSEIDEKILEIPPYQLFAIEAGAKCLFFVSEWGRETIYPDRSYNTWMVCDIMPDGAYRAKTSESEIQYSQEEIIAAIAEIKK